MNTPSVILYMTINVIILLVYISLRCHNICCLETAKQDTPVQQRFSQHRDKGMMLLLIGIIVVGVILHQLFCIPYLLLRQSFGKYELHRFQGDFSLGTLFMVYPLTYIFWEFISKLRFGKEYDEYCASYSIRQMSEGAAHPLDNPVMFHREALKTNRFLLWFGVFLAILSLLSGIFDLNEYAYFDDTFFHYCEFGSLQEREFSPGDFEAIYKVDTFVSFVGKKINEPFYAFVFRDGTRILFRPVQASAIFIQRAIDFTHLPVVSIPML